MLLNKKVSPTSACFPGKPIETAMSLLIKNNPKDNCLTKWDFSEVQLCPQHIGFISSFTTQTIKDKYPNIQFRLHANVRLNRNHRPFDASHILEENLEYIKQLKEIQNQLNSKVYSYHAPMHEMSSWEKIAQNTLELQDFLNIPVAIEGLYPNKKYKDLWSNSINAYESLLKTNLFYALDLSHLNIAYEQYSSTQRETIKQLVIEMLENKNCLEIHISDNDGKHDSHKPISDEKWWLEPLNNSKINSRCVIFCESNQS